MKLQTKYITPDDFLNYTGIDLGAQLRGNANPSDKAMAFLNRIEVRMEAYLNANFFKLIRDEYPRFTDFQKEHYKYALLEQALYVFRNGDISIDSGYDPDEGIKASRHALKELILSPNAIDHLRLCGLWSRHIGKTDYFGEWFGWEQ